MICATVYEEIAVHELLDYACGEDAAHVLAAEAALAAALSGRAEAHLAAREGRRQGLRDGQPRALDAVLRGARGWRRSRQYVKRLLEAGRRELGFFLHSINKADSPR